MLTFIIYNYKERCDSLSVKCTISGSNKKIDEIFKGTGKYSDVKGHHPMAKKAFEGSKKYSSSDAFSISSDALDSFDVKHSSITGKQMQGYKRWKKNNPNGILTLDDMSNIEKQAMKDAGIPDGIADIWVDNAIKDLKGINITNNDINMIPWVGSNK